MTKLPNTVGNSVYELIKRDIIRGALAPGSKLKLEPLKAQYSASISTLRESLNRLGSEGFVRGRGTTRFLRHGYLRRRPERDRASARAVGMRCA